MLTTPSQVKNLGNISDSVDDLTLEPHITRASIDVKKILTAEKYNEIETLQTDDEIFIACSIAEASLAFAYALPSLNIVTQGTGILKTKGWDVSRSEVRNQDEIEKLQEYYRNYAMRLLKPFIPQPGLNSGLQSDEIRGGDYMLAAL